MEQLRAGAAELREREAQAVKKSDADIRGLQSRVRNYRLQSKQLLARRAALLDDLSTLERESAPGTGRWSGVWGGTSPGRCGVR